ncbi:MAG: hypothetical protein VR66_17120 [Peptococcaceae bacterium BRH_c23]|nr:MAG: hypothetical protein VR66_17120 [Peptococcaceae bacterium BRH_c23]KJS81635.1 MAG: hypothetical protein JL57_26220 [Desulfosporosinus sp. BICA1-9]HBW35553.1 hypothetical protein [Desulfosporosinus sp.]
MNKRVYGNISFKVNWQGEIVAIQPRTRVWRYLMVNVCGKQNVINVFGPIWLMLKFNGILRRT